MAATSAPATEAAKKRGRPKKVVVDAAGPKSAKKAGVKPALTSAKATKAQESNQVPAQTLAKSNSNAPKPSRTPSNSVKPPQTSKIIEAVRATGTLGKATTTATGKPDATASSRPSTAPTPATPSNTSIPDPTPQAQQTPKPKPTPTSTRPPPPPNPSKRTSTIPLPSRPRVAPSPSLAKPAAPSATHHAIPRAVPPRTRIIEPTPDIRLPPKYKPAARRVTAIIVGIPIILVVGWELYGRWKGEVRKKWGEKGERV
ncbi:hypothetical protein BKA63DRAFT_563782 [Paraphoma chrysanthemicola]|nr:hypothetical protein BKA63DRAFT_563782 [Paraphoma chrysanthemicola]